MPLLASNFTSNLLYGTTIVSGGWANVDLRVDAFAFEGDKTFVVKLRKDSTLGQVLGTSAPITIKDYTGIVSLSANISTVNEGDLVQLTLTTTNVVNYTNVAYSVFPVTANVTSADFVASTGYITIINNIGVFALQANTDLSLMDETGETFRVQIRDRNNTNTYISSNITIADISKGVNVLSFAESAAATAEGGTLTLTFTATNAGNRVLYYTTNGNATTSTFAGGNTGSFVMGPLSNTITLLPTGVPYGITQNFTVQVRTGSTTGPVVATSNSLIAVDSSIAYMSASGGTIVDSGGYRLHAFTTSGNLTINSLGAGAALSSIEYLAIAGGGAGYHNTINGYGGSGGGAGGLINRSFVATTTGNTTITIGAGGTGATDVQNRGSNTIVLSGGTTITAVGGGAGAWITAGQNGGSGGGAAQSPTTRIAASGYGYPGPTQQGFPGSTSGPGLFHGGGGGAGQEGQESTAPRAGNGGRGAPISWAPASYGTTGPAPGRYFAGGGGGGDMWQFGSPLGGLGGAGGGGAAIFSGNVNTGGGGGGGNMQGAEPAGGGGSGIVLIRYPYLPPATFSNVVTTASSFVVGSNITFTLNAINANAYTYYYTTEGNVISSDFVGGNTGSFVANASGAVFTLRANTNIPLNETRSFVLRIREDSITGVIRVTSANITIDAFATQISATGGAIATAGGYRTHTFLSSDSFVLSKQSTDNVEYLIVAGGGSGGLSYGGGGGAGGMLYGNLTYQQISSGTYSIVVGAGGTSQVNGSNSSGLGILSIGGGAGGFYSPSASPVDQAASAAKVGGAGGGAASGLQSYGPAPDGTWPGGLGVTGQGFSGGTRLQPNPGINYSGYESAGGGGAGGIGANVSVRNEKGGNGGIGLQWVNGTYYSGGGGGWGYQSPTADAPSYSNTPSTESLGLGGLGGGGNGAKYYPGRSPAVNTSTSGNVNTGGGGGGAYTGSVANTAGGSGIVIIRYPYV